MRTDGVSEAVASVWASIRGLAEQRTREAPLLARMMRERILDAPSFTVCLAQFLATELGDPWVPAEALVELLTAVADRHPDILESATLDLQAFCSRDPSCEDALVAFLNHKGFRALQAHRFAHALWKEGERALSRHIHGRVTMVFAIDIHPAACVGRGVFIDHGTALVIGETAVVEDDVSLLHQVTLGGTGKATGDRHPKIRRGVMIGAGAAVLGNIEVGEGSKIAAGSVVLRPVPPHTTAAGVPATLVGHPKEEQPALYMLQDILKEEETG